MILMPSRHWTLHLRAVVALLVVVAACTEPVAHDVAPAPVQPALELLFADASAARGSEVRVTVHLRDAGAVRVSSYTARVSYDTTSLAFVGEDAANDGAMRASNAEKGQVRLAGALDDGFAGGNLTTLRFIVHGGDPRSALRVSVNELHTVAHANLLPSLVP